MSADPVIVVVRAAAAAIVTLQKLPDHLKRGFDGTQKFVVHPHLAAIEADNQLLGAYLKNVYATQKSIGVEYPAAQAFRAIGTTDGLEAGITELAEALAAQMSKKNANPGILFGFQITVDGAAAAHGVIKADFDDETRFHFKGRRDGGWSLSEVTDVLPPPRSSYAKYAIAPRPLGSEPAGVHDITDSGSAADYFLESIALVVPRTRGTRALVAQAAIEHGYTVREISEAFATINETKPLDEVIDQHFPQIPPKRRERLKGSETRPVTSVIADDPYLTTYSTKSPRFELTVGEGVMVSVEGRTVTVTLPPDGDQIEVRAR